MSQPKITIHLDIEGYGTLHLSEVENFHMFAPPIPDGYEVDKDGEKWAKYKPSRYISLSFSALRVSTRHEPI